MFQLIKEKAPDLVDHVKLVMTDSNKDDQEMRDVIGTKQYRQSLANLFKKEDAILKK